MKTIELNDKDRFYLYFILDQRLSYCTKCRDEAQLNEIKRYWHDEMLLAEKYKRKLID